MKQRATLWSVVRQLLPAFLLCAAFVGAGIVHASGRMLVVRTGYRLSELQSENRALTRENDRLRLELATLKGPGRLEKLAREQLGMGPPAATAVVTGPPAPRLGRPSPKESPR
jgi:cell division protein FtsL